MLANNYQSYIDWATRYIESQQEKDGTFPFFWSTVNHWDSIDWTTACMGSSLFTVIKDPAHPSINKAKEALVKLQRKDGGWAYNGSVPSDPDSTLRVLQFFQKISLADSQIFESGYNFIVSHQDPITGWIRTYTPERLANMGYQWGGWDQPHMCVSALAYSILPDSPYREKVRNFLEESINNASTHPYWWTIGNYTRWELRKFWIGMESPWEDAVDLSLSLMGTQWNTRHDIMRLLSLFQEDGSVQGSKIFHIPKPNFPPWMIPPEHRVIEDDKRMFSTATASVALYHLAYK